MMSTGVECLCQDQRAALILCQTDADALKVGTSPGRPPKLKAAQQRGLLRVPLKGPLAHGYNTNVWTTARIAEVITREFGVSYHRDHVGRLMHS
jgi:transposase